MTRNKKPSKWQAYIKKFLYWRPVRTMLHASRMLVLPGFQGVGLFDVVLFFFRGMKGGVLTQRAAAMSYQFFLSLFPLLLAGFTLLPFFHLERYISMITDTLMSFMPESTSNFLNTTIRDLLSHKHKGLMSIGFLSSLYVASSAFNTLMLSFNTSKHALKKRPFLVRRLIAIGMVIGVFVAVIVSFTLILSSRTIINYLLSGGILEGKVQIFLLKLIKWSVIIFLIYIVVASVYYITPVDKRGFKFFSAGATFSTVMFILMSLSFNFYIKNFSHYNSLYGSIGAIIIFLLWLYINSYVLIIGFELNASIADAYNNLGGRKEHKNQSRIKISRTSRNMIKSRRIKFIRGRNKFYRFIRGRK